MLSLKMLLHFQGLIAWVYVQQPGLKWAASSSQNVTHERALSSEGRPLTEGQIETVMQTVAVL